MSEAFDPKTFNPHDAAFLRDPYPTYSAFRKQAPVAPVETYKSYWVFRYEDVKQVLTDKHMFLKSPAPARPAPGPFEAMGNMPPGVFMMEAPRHDEVRPLLNPMLARSISDAGEVAQAIASNLIETNMSGGSRFDLYSSYALPLPCEVLMTVMGVPEAHRPGVSQWVAGFLAGHDVTQSIAIQGAGGTCMMALSAYYQGLIRGCPMAGKPRMIDEMVAGAKTNGMTIEEVQSSALNFNVAGHMSSTFLIATGMLALLQNRHQLEMLRDDRELMGAAVEELLRFESPFQLVDRYVAKATKLGGVKLKAGDLVQAVIGSANRDPEVFPEPDRLDIRRDNSKHLGFGDGIHQCIGDSLARTMIPVAFGALFDAFPSIELAGIPQFQTDPYIRSVSNLPLAVGPATN